MKLRAEKGISGLFHLKIHGGGGGVERSPIKKSWGEGVKIKKIIGRGVCQILKNMGWGGGGGVSGENARYAKTPDIQVMP